MCKMRIPSLPPKMGEHAFTSPSVPSRKTHDSTWIPHPVLQAQLILLMSQRSMPRHFQCSWNMELRAAYFKAQKYFSWSPCLPGEDLCANFKSFENPKKLLFWISLSMNRKCPCHTPILPGRHLGLREVKSLVQSHTAGTCQAEAVTALRACDPDLPWVVTSLVLMRKDFTRSLSPDLK